MNERFNNHLYVEPAVIFSGLCFNKPMESKKKKSCSIPIKIVGKKKRRLPSFSTFCGACLWCERHRCHNDTLVYVLASCRICGVLHGSVVKCLTCNPGVLGSSRTGSSGFFVGVSLGKTLQNPT